MPPSARLDLDQSHPGLLHWRTSVPVSSWSRRQRSRCWRYSRRPRCAEMANDGIGHRFIEQSRKLLTDSYLPRIEQALEGLSDERIWWRPNPESNSIGN